MRCPACFNELTQTQIGSLKVDVCQGGCGGIWFDAFELQRVDEEEEAAGEPLLHVKRDPGITVDPQRKRDCPHCAEMRLHRHFFSAKRKVEVDQCPNCGGYWLDAGELAQIRTEKAADTNAQKLQTGLSSAEIRYLYPLNQKSASDLGT